MEAICSALKPTQKLTLQKKDIEEYQLYTPLEYRRQKMNKKEVLFYVFASSELEDS